MCLAIPGKIISISPYHDEISKSGKVSFGGIIQDVSLMMVPEAKVSDYVLVHVGVAIYIVDELEANKTLRYLEEMGELNEHQIEE
ncbi:MAG: HypC/HybG/HupF family hydrogenase formation chaperone [Saprospiraceae bacterium]|nr:HypC/HybG/HupF family hydrogenase formation chaperone [Saprospiraceae bacterium]